MIRSRIGRVFLALLIGWSAMLPVATTAYAQTPDLDSATQTQVVGDPLTPGTSAIVIGGDCLRLRDVPSLNGERLTCIPDGRTVTVLPATQEADGYRWQLIQWRDLTGWVADVFLAPYDGPPQAESCQAASSTRPGITGEVPSGGGFGLIVWGGGTVGGRETAALTQDCLLSSVWASRPSGGFVGYRFGAPEFVNREWGQSVNSAIEAGTPLLIVCAPPGSAISVRSTKLPAPTRDAPVLVGSQAAPAITARAAVVIDEASGEILYDLNAHSPLPPASLTKIVTAILAMEGSDVNGWVNVLDVDWRQMPGSSIMGIIPGDCFTVTDLLYGLMLPSGNDAALAIARHNAGSDAAFVAQMNTLMRRLGLTDSYFTDPHGLGSNEHVMSAYDIAMLSRYAMTQFPLFRTIVATRSWTAVGDRDVPMLNVNSFLGQFNEADGVKTGFTEEAGRTLSASATRDGHRIYVVILNDDDRYTDAAELLDWAFENYVWD